MKINEDVVRVGMAAIIVKECKVLMHKRKGKHSPGVWSFPGGHLEYKESFEEGIRREIKEETGLDVGKIEGPVAVTREFYNETGKSYITLFMNVEYIDGEARVMEPDKCECWKWFGKNELPENLMLPVKNLIDSGYDIFGWEK